MRDGPEVADVFRRHGAAYREAHAGHLSLGQKRVMAAIEAFAGRAQRDDLTLVLARARAADHAKLSVSPVATSPGKTERHLFWT